VRVCDRRWPLADVSCTRATVDRYLSVLTSNVTALVCHEVPRLLAPLVDPVTRISILDRLHIVKADCRESFDPNILLFSQVPSLRTVVIEQFRSLYTSTHLPWKQLTRLAICHTEKSAILVFIGRNCPVLEELSFVLLDDTEDEAQPPLVFQVLRKLQIKVTSRISPLFFLPFTLPALQYFGLFSDPIVSSPAFQWFPITTAHDYLYHLLRNLRSLKLGYQCISNTMLINILRLLPLLEVLVVDSELQSYIRVAHGSLFSSIFASFFVPFFARFGGRFHHLAGKNGMKITIKNGEKRLL